MTKFSLIFPILAAQAIDDNYLNILNTNENMFLKARCIN